MFSCGIYSCPLFVILHWCLFLILFVCYSIGSPVVMFASFSSTIVGSFMTRLDQFMFLFCLSRLGRRRSVSIPSPWFPITQGPTLSPTLVTVQPRVAQHVARRNGRVDHMLGDSDGRTETTPRYRDRERGPMAST